VVPGVVMAKDSKVGKLKPVWGSELIIDTGCGVRVDITVLVKTDIGADNTVIPVIDTVGMSR
jgi:uncharacterized surface protein with fasciclin (FAS1) repeats